MHFLCIFQQILSLFYPSSTPRASQAARYAQEGRRKHTLPTALHDASAPCLEDALFFILPAGTDWRWSRGPGELPPGRPIAFLSSPRSFLPCPVLRGDGRAGTEHLTPPALPAKASAPERPSVRQDWFPLCRRSPDQRSRRAGPGSSPPPGNRINSPSVISITVCSLCRSP